VAHCKDVTFVGQEVSRVGCRSTSLSLGIPGLYKVLEIQSKILPKYGFSGDAKGVLNMKMEVALLSRKD
jgi:hypothetical protein